MTEHVEQRTKHLEFKFPWLVNDGPKNQAHQAQKSALKRTDHGYVYMLWDALGGLSAWAKQDIVNFHVGRLSQNMGHAARDVLGL